MPGRSTPGTLTTGSDAIHHAFVYLASQSPRRAQLLEQIGVVFRPLAPGPKEDMEALEEERSNEAPRDYVQRVTLRKLQAAEWRLGQRRLPPAPILVADTTVVLGRRMLAKPEDAADAARMLRLLAGRTHRVLTAVAVGGPGLRAMFATSVSRVRFAALSEQMIARYIESGEPFGKAGAYAIQGRMAAWVEHIEGSHSGIMGLPLFETRQLLAQARVRMNL